MTIHIHKNRSDCLGEIVITNKMRISFELVVVRTDERTNE